MNEQEQAGAPSPTGGEPPVDGAAGQEEIKPRARRARGHRGGRRHKSAAARAAARAAAPLRCVAEATEAPSTSEPAPATPKAGRARKEPEPAATSSEGGPQPAKAKSTSRRRRSGRGRKAVTEELKTAEAAPGAPPAAVPGESGPAAMCRWWPRRRRRKEAACEVAQPPPSFGPRSEVSHGRADV